MIDFGSILAITTMFAVRDYYNDKEKMKKEKANQYKICFDKIGDNVETLGNIIISTLEKSGRVDLENEIIKGAQQIPLYILLEVVKIQGRPITSHQRKIIDICFNNFRHLGFTKQDYFTALASDNQTRKKLAESVELSIDYCGEFWEKYIDLVYTTSMSERSFTKLISCYSEIVVRLSLLGDCNVDRAEWVYKKFSDGLEVHMQKYATGETTRNKVDVIEPYKEMRVNCSNLDKAVNEDGILIDLFDYFIVAFILGYIEKIEITENLKRNVLEYFMDKLALDVDATASEIYLNYKADLGMKQVFFDSANNWDGANFWKIHLISAIRANKENDAIEFMDDAIRFLQLIEADIISAFSFPEISGNANKYMENVIRQMQTLGLKGEPSFKGEKKRIAPEVTTANVIESDYILDERYFRAIDKSNGKKLEDLQFCIDEFEKLGDWKDSIKYKEECIDKVIQILSTAEKQSENGDSKKTVIPIKREPMDTKKKKRMIIIGAIVICVAIACGVAISAISAAKAYEDIAGVYEFSSIEVLDPFDYPGDGAGDCNIKSDGHIEFPYYDGAFKMASGKLTEYTGIDGYEYEVLIQGEGPRRAYINIYGGSMEIHMESRQDFISGAVFFRELIFNFYK